jgi:hypothetical protein
MHDMIHELMRHNNIPIASSAVDSYGSAVARPISALDSYGSAVAQPISASDSYGSAVAQPLGAVGATDSYGSPLGQTISAALPTYGGSSGTVAQLPTYGGSSFSPSLATYNGGGAQRSASSIAAAAAASDSYLGPSVSDTFTAFQEASQPAYSNVRNRRKNVFVASPKFNPPEAETEIETAAEAVEKAEQQATTQKIKVTLSTLQFATGKKM